MPSRTLVLDSNQSGNVLGSFWTEESNVESQKLDLNAMWTVRDILQRKYIHTEKLNGRTMSYGAVKGMVMALDDPYTEYMTPDETVEFNESLNSELEGIGAELTMRDDILTVVNTIKGSPAEKAGLLPDDMVLLIEDEMTADMDLFEAIGKIRGEKGSTVTLTVIRGKEGAPFDLEIVRDTITVESVVYEEHSPGIWHVEVNQFSDDTKIEFIRAMNDIKSKSPKGIVLDLRFNGGGYLNGAVDILSAFIRGEKEVVKIEYREDKLNETLKTDGAPQFPELPLVVLINRGSASASEIVAAAIQDLKRGVIMGETSYGKGTVQEVDPLQDGSSLRFTIAHWLSPLGNSVNEVGVVPDREIKFTDEDFEELYDRQLEEAVKYLQEL